ncbi:MAG: geranylgeranylglyceryl/heptaprenylglyceryl phosphate synthase [Cyclobacteriaceae bacterium]|nr:geranylgeranylglyceryl/heptaprenylglyceryl phosphate synthase [Cyclobacteriaceae bacterium]
MKTGKILNLQINHQLSGKKSLAVLIDPDKISDPTLFNNFINNCNDFPVDVILCGGSLLANGSLEKTILAIKKLTDIPIVIFPGSNFHVSQYADAILLLSLISGGNAQFLIGEHVVAAPLLKQANIEIIPTAYILVESGGSTTVQYISNTMPIPAHKPEIGVCTAMAGEMLGLQIIYLDAGSGAKLPVPAEFIASVKAHTEVPLWVGGGIKTVEMAYNALKAGADTLVIGTVMEKNPAFLRELSEVYQVFNSKISNIHQ